jgi:Fe(3+) dicitrate transport protein
MTLKVCSTIFILLMTTDGLAQYRLSGSVTVKDSSAVREILVLLNDDSRTAVTDRKGNFVFEDVANGDYVIHFTSDDYAYHTIRATINNRDEHVRVSLTPRDQVLQEVVVTDAPVNFGFTRMRSVENVGIYEGKKSEVIIPEQLVANLATNNARQIYSRVAGLNIWENDGAGIQLSIGGRGLDPNRTSNFNVRQNGYDISADALGYPESYYTPPVEGIGRIQIVRGAASLQYGTQFGGLINFAMKKPVENKRMELVIRQTGGSFGFYNAFASASGTMGKLSYYAFFQYKRGDGWRPNSHFNNHTAYANVNYTFTKDTKLGIDVTQMGYLAQQPGGLSDAMFDADPRQSNRQRNWFSVDWNLLALHFDHKFSANSEFNLRLFGLLANRFSVGFRPNRVETEDDGSSRRDLIKGNFENWGIEARYLKRYEMFSKPSVVLVGSRFYHGFNHSRQGSGTGGKGANFSFPDEDQDKLYDYDFPNENTSVFLENIVYLHEKLSLTPGVRFEYINTLADGYYDEIQTDLAGNIIFRDRHPEKRRSERNFVIMGLGIGYKPKSNIELYTNLSQNYRSITFNDMRIINQSAEIDQGLDDEKGFSFDLGVRSEQTLLFNYDVSYFYLNYDNRIGEASLREGSRPYRFRTNIGQAIIQGIEAYGEVDILGYLYPRQHRWSGVVFGNLGFIHSEYKKSIITNVAGNEVEFIPDVNLKTGFRVGYHDIKLSLQYTYLSQQFTNAQNSNDKNDPSAVTSIIPEYSVIDLSLSYQYKRCRVEGSANNLANAMYFTRRATGYPGPGILPSDGRSFFLTLQVKI